MSNEPEKPADQPEQKPAPAEQPKADSQVPSEGAAPKPSESKPLAAAPEKAAEGENPKPAPAAAKPAAPEKAAEADKPKPAPAAKPAAAAPAGHAPAPAAVAPSEPGQYGQFLKDHGIASTRLADSCGVETVELESNNLVAAMKLLRKEGLTFLITVTGVDSAETFDSVYHLWSYADPTSELVVKVRVRKSSVGEDQLPLVPSLANVWETSNWHERETYDLVGIRYVGHPYLRRMLNPWDWQGHPLRRDYRQIIDSLNNKAAGSFR